MVIWPHKHQSGKSGQNTPDSGSRKRHLIGAEKGLFEYCVVDLSCIGQNAKAQIVERDSGLPQLAEICDHWRLGRGFRSQPSLVYRPQYDNSAFYTPRVRSKPTHEKQYNEDDQNDTDHTYAAVTEAVAIAAEATTEATKQEDDEDDNKYESDRHDLSPVAAPSQTLSLFAI